MIDFEEVMQALVDHVQTKVPDFVSASRRLKHWTQVQDQPAFFLRRTGTIDHYNGNMPITTLQCEGWIYCNAGKDPAVAPDEVLTGLEMALRNSFAPNDGLRFTLGGLVHWCRIEGKSDMAAGDQGAQAIARIPILITLPM